MTRRSPQRGKVLDPAWRHARAVTAGLASKAAHARLHEQRGARFVTKGRAYAAGYRQGYSTAMHWWLRKFARTAAGLRVRR